MSMPSLVTDWMRNRLDWGYVSATKLAPTTLQPGEMFQLPRSEYVFSYPEGVLLQFSAGFDHPSCGIRLEQNPGLDLGTDFTVMTIAMGLSRPEVLVYATIPPTTPPGWYAVRICSQWPFKDWMRLYVFNSDTVPHTMLGHSYHLAVLKEKRRDESIVPLKEIAEAQHAASLYPETREALRRRLRGRLDQYLERMGVKTP